MKAFAARLAVFGTLPIAVVFGALLAYWPSLYFTIPALLPATPYLDGQYWTIPVLNSLAIGFIAALITRKMDWRRSSWVFCLVWLIATLVTHGVFQAMGYKFYMELV